MKISFKDNNGVIPRFFKQLHCSLWIGHEWYRTSPEYQGMACYTCSKCGKTTVM